MNRFTMTITAGAVVVFAAACASGSPVSIAGPSESASAGGYVSKQFARPLEVDVPAWLPAQPTADEPNFLTWTGEGAAVDRAVRFLVPVNLYPPGSTVTASVPDDYLGYLRTQTRHGARLTDQKALTVGGLPATILTAATSTSLDGSLGCPAEGVAAPDCYGLQPGLALRIAIIDVGDTTLLIWARGVDGASDQAREFADFERMLATVYFR
jgi:hypothetical protein